MRHAIMPSPEEIAENEKAYLEQAAIVERLEAELRAAKGALRCRFCGASHYTQGFCSPCYSRAKNGLPLNRVVRRSKYAVSNYAQQQIYSKVYFSAPSADFDLQGWAESIVNGAKDKTMKEVARMWLLDGKTLAQIGAEMNYTRQWASLLMDKFANILRESIAG